VFRHPHLNVHIQQRGVKNPPGQSDNIYLNDPRPTALKVTFKHEPTMQNTSWHTDMLSNHGYVSHDDMKQREFPNWNAFLAVSGAGFGHKERAFSL
jgi:hypothetical protein